MLNKRGAQKFSSLENNWTSDFGSLQAVGNKGCNHQSKFSSTFFFYTVISGETHRKAIKDQWSKGHHRDQTIRQLPFNWKSADYIRNSARSTK